MTLSGPHQAIRLPVEAALDHPAQDAGPFRPELFRQLPVDMSAGVRVKGMRLKRRRAASSTFRSSGLWLPMMVSLKCGWKVKKSCRMNRAVMRIAAGHLLDPAFGPCAAFFGFARRHQPRAAQHGQLGRVPVELRGGERLHRLPLRHSRAMMPATVFSQTALAVAAVAEPEHQRVLADVAGQAIAVPLLDEPDQLGHRRKSRRETGASAGNRRSRPARPR